MELLRKYVNTKVFFFLQKIHKRGENREANNSADLLAKRGVTINGRIIEWFTQNIG